VATVGLVATVNSWFELTVGLSGWERPTVRRALTVACILTSGYKLFRLKASSSGEADRG
jgi:hypothetical protein